ncbi:2,4'-dihydroxyacetophenone dioxygenase family protein [Lignipirellula cremea]|uniref:ChrR Cupin-like domain protein n=1 Tax=Lignipirellula cremea TaxID=2528010 RepID=A0A518DYR0_9BACT|nr:2,4'-dihydroxyacetophenone dioxygenase family protein [Lignipirellula cremea]QDU96983.1 ChrR Cupin-like domain protein [Lignipirellula cremea]
MDVPARAVADLVTVAIPEDERLWVPQAPQVWFRPLLLDRTTGNWVNLLRVRTAGVLSRHRHPAPVHGYVISGSWRYLEHDWIAQAGMYVFEPPGEVHTLVVDEGVEEMITLFHVFGALLYYNEQDQLVAHDDVHTKIELCERHFEKVGLGAGFVEQFIR